MTVQNDQENKNEDINFDFEIESDGDQDQEEQISIPKSKIAHIKQILGNIKDNYERLNDILSIYSGNENLSRIEIGQLSDSNFLENKDDDEKEAGKIVEGVFDGENMVGPDGKVYSVPSNYASKSKLVEGDILKLTITGEGTFVYKQIGPIDRKRVVGNLERTSDGNFYVVLDNRKWRILSASVTYFKGSEGDEVVLLVPKIGDSQWGAVENIIRKNS